MKTVPKTNAQLWEEMAALTQEMCKGTRGICKGKGQCCHSMYCESAKRYALTKGVKLEEIAGASLPFCGPEGCIVHPQYRPLCTVHQCCLEFATGKNAKRYWKLREKLDKTLGDAG